MEKRAEMFIIEVLSDYYCKKKYKQKAPELIPRAELLLEIE